LQPDNAGRDVPMPFSPRRHDARLRPHEPCRARKETAMPVLQLIAAACVAILAFILPLLAWI
jgi:hypothetical protein